MTTSEVFGLLLSCLVGILLGSVYFFGLWWTIRGGTSARVPALWFVGSLVLRMALLLGGFYLATGGRWDRLLACLAGFVVARALVRKRVLKGSVGNQPVREARHAP